MASKYVDDQTIDKFLNELESLCLKYGLSLAHEDHHGAFVIEKFDEGNIRWLKAAHRSAKYE